MSQIHTQFVKYATRLALIILLVTMVAIPVAAQEDADPILTPDATIDEIANALATAHERYETLYVKIIDYDHLHDSVMTDEMWLSQPQGAWRWYSTSTSPEGETLDALNISDGEYNYMSYGITGEPLVNRMWILPEGVVHNFGLVSTVIAPRTPARRVADPDARVEIAGVEIINERETIKVMYANEWMMLNLWVDMQSGILMMHEVWTPEGEIVSTVVVDTIQFDPVFTEPASLFAVDGSAYDPDLIQSIFDALEAAPTTAPDG